MAFPRKLLNDREELVLDLRPHWIYMAPSVGLLLVGIVIGGVVLAADLHHLLKTVLYIVSGLIIVAALGYFAKRYAGWATTNFVLTGERVISRRGVIGKSGIEIPLERINTVFFHQSILERMVGAGDLTIESAGERGSETFSDIRHPQQVQREIYVQMEANTNRGYERMGQYAARGAPAPAPAAAAPTLSVPEQLEKLDELRRRGVLNEAEFQAQKNQVLGQGTAGA